MFLLFFYLYYFLGAKSAPGVRRPPLENAVLGLCCSRLSLAPRINRRVGGRGGIALSVRVSTREQSTTNRSQHIFSPVALLNILKEGRKNVHPSVT